MKHDRSKILLPFLSALLLAAIPCVTAQAQQGVAQQSAAQQVIGFPDRDQAWSYSCPQNMFRPDLGNPQLLPAMNTAPQYAADYPGENYPGERSSNGTDEAGNFNISGDAYHSSLAKQPTDTPLAPDPLMALTTDKLAAVYGPADVTTMLLDGEYKLGSSDPQNPHIQPFLTGGLGVAVLDQSLYSASAGTPDRSYLPMYQVGGGLSYALQNNFGLSLSYRASFTQDNGNSFMLTSHDPSQIDTQMIDLGVNYKF